MKFVDEFRDPAAARALVKSITELATGERVQIHGSVRRSHAHHLPPRHRAPAARRGRAGARAGLSGVRDPDGPRRRRDVAGRAARCHLHDFRRHDAGPGLKGNLIEAKARGADVRFVYSPLDALKVAVDNPDRQVVFFAVGFETTAPSTAVTLVRARELGVTNFTVFCNHVTIVPPIKAILESPDLRLSGSWGPVTFPLSWAHGPIGSCPRSTENRWW